jgi:hypothetical protein
MAPTIRSIRCRTGSSRLLHRDGEVKQHLVHTRLLLPAVRDLETLVAMAGTDEVVRLRLLRALRDLRALSP